VNWSNDADRNRHAGFKSQGGGKENAVESINELTHMR
jgi:hypothetical protein